MREEARTAAERLEALVREREAERKQLLETQAALSEALNHLESVSTDAEVLICICNYPSQAITLHHMGVSSFAWLQRMMATRMMTLPCVSRVLRG